MLVFIILHHRSATYLSNGTHTANPDFLGMVTVFLDLTKAPFLSNKGMWDLGD